MLRLILLALVLVTGTTCHAQIKLPDLSPRAEISQKIGLSTVSISYSRPSLRGRSLFGREGILVEGEKWRTGANATTTITFSSDVKIGNLWLEKGKYVILSTPHTDHWTFHFYPYAKGAYTSFIDQQPVIEITVLCKSQPNNLETLSLHFESIGLNSADLVLQWEVYKAVVPLKFDEHTSILNNIEKVLEGPSSFNYFQAALYLHETQTDLPRALVYIQKATAGEDALFFQVYREALILKDLSKNREAIKAAKRCQDLAKRAENHDFIRLSQQIIDDLSGKGR